MPTHTTDRERTVLIGVSADNADMLAAIRAAASESRLVRLEGGTARPFDIVGAPLVARRGALAEDCGHADPFPEPRPPLRRRDWDYEPGDHDHRTGKDVAA